MKDNSVEMSVLFDFYGAILTPKQQAFFDYYHNNDLSLAEIAENEGITRQGVRDVLMRGERILRDMEHSLGLAGRLGGLQQAMQEIRADAQTICDVNGRRVFNAEIRDRAENIIRLCGSSE